MTDTPATQSHLSEVTQLLQNEQLFAVKRILNGLRDIEIARLLESSPPTYRNIIWSLIDEENRGVILQELSDDVTRQFVQAMDSMTVAELTESLDADDVADILQQLPDQGIQEVLNSMSEQNRARIQTVLSFEEDTAGGLMNTDIITVRPKFTLDVVLRYLRRHDEIPDSTDQIFVVNSDNIFLGSLSLSKLLVSDPNSTVRELMRTNTVAINAAMPDSEVANLFERNDWVSAPVVDDNNRIVGRITIDDVVDVILEEADHSIMGRAGIEEGEDTFAPLLRTAPKRAIWLGINLLTAVLASFVISLFQETLDKVVALAVLMPIVASMGGVAGSQTLTVVIRGMAVGKIGASNRHWLLTREILSGLLNGLLWAVVLAIFTAFWLGIDDGEKGIVIGLIIAAATIVNLLTAAIGGCVIPVLLKKFGIDPALAGGVALTTVTDVVGFMAFLGLATWFLG